MQGDTGLFDTFKSNLRSMFDLMRGQGSIPLEETNCIIPALPADVDQYDLVTFNLREQLIALDNDYAVELTFKAYIETIAMPDCLALN